MRNPQRTRTRGDARGDHGTTAIIGFVAVVGVYAVAFAVFMMWIQAPNTVHKDTPILDNRAIGGLDQLLGSAGFSANGTAGANLKAWYQQPDGITRFGLSVDGQPGTLDPAKLANLTRGSVARNSSNNLLDYEEARDALGMGSETQFHLRSYPMFASRADAGPKPVKGLNVSYVADFSSTSVGSNNFPIQYATTLVNLADAVYVNVTVTNNGTQDTMLQAQFSLVLDRGYFTDTADTKLLGRDPDGAGAAVGANQTLSLRLAKTTAWKWGGSDKNVTIRINDPSKQVASFQVDLAGINMSSGASGGYGGFSASPMKLTYMTNQKPMIQYDLWTGDGDTVKKPVVNITIRANSNNTIMDQWEGDSGTSNQHEMANKLPAGNYTLAVFYVANATHNTTDTIVITDGSLLDFASGPITTLTESAASKYERGLVLDLVERFVNSTYDAGGHVYPDLPSVMNTNLADDLAAGKIMALVVGTNVSQTAMTSGAAQDAVKKFVLGGGLLIVLGSANQDATWLQPLVQATITTSGNSVGIPDTTNPVLHTPQELAFGDYLDGGRTWQYGNGAVAAHFSHIVTRASGTTGQDVLGLSKPGHFGNGTIILTAWELFALTSPQVDSEASNTLYNFLLHAAGNLYVDFGPAVPDRADVSSSTRIATAANPVIPGERLLVRMMFYVFR